MCICVSDSQKKKTILFLHFPLISLGVRPAIQPQLAASVVIVTITISLFVYYFIFLEIVWLACWLIVVKGKGPA